jgi:23S rRNA (cytidine1920-2'-O)/16S rRNA (cytidine1409-2'-O)-methyltransferase
MAKEKKRLDILTWERFPQFSRNYVQSIIMQRKVSVDGKIIDKPGTKIDVELEITVDAKEPKYVSRAGFKLEKALDHFNVNVKDLIVLDAGISTGGFTDCLLQRGVKRVYGIDVGYGQVHEKLLSDDRLILMERTNLRKVETLPDKIDLVTLDLSFISILKVMPAIIKVIKPDAKIITLIKPQFEAEREDVCRGGLIRDEAVYEKVFEKIETGMKEFGFKAGEIIESPILGAASGNKEFLAMFEKE